MRSVHVVGAGGIGVAVGWSLAKSGCDVLFVESNARKVEEGRRAGAEVVGRGALPARFAASGEWRPSADAWTLLSTKTYDNVEALARLPATRRLVPVQNGYDPELEALDHPFEGISSFVSEGERDRPRTRITRPGILHFGRRGAASPEEDAELRELADAIDAARLVPVRVVADIRPYKATKLMYNAAISPLAAAAGLDNAALLTDPLARGLFFALLLENYAILSRREPALARIGPFHPRQVDRILRAPALAGALALFFRRGLRGTYCSMTPDVRSGGRTELEAYNGHLLRIAGELPCRLNRAVHAMVRAIETERRPPSRDHLVNLARDLDVGATA